MALGDVVAVENLGDPDEIVKAADAVFEEVPRQGVDAVA